MKKLVEVKELCRCYEGEATEVHYQIVGTEVGFIERPHWKERQFGSIKNEEVIPYE